VANEESQVQVKDQQGTIATYVKGEELGDGGCGVVWAYTSGAHAIAVKVLEDPEDPELAVVRALETGERCGVVLAKVVETSHVKGAWVAMELMHGTLTDLVDAHGLLEPVRTMEVIDKLGAQLRCLARLEPPLLYTDLKASNVLYHRGPDTGLTVRLGDLGSMGVHSGGHFSTYPYMPRSGHVRDVTMQVLHTFPDQSDARDCIVYQLAALAAYLAFGVSIGTALVGGDRCTCGELVQFGTQRIKYAHDLAERFPDRWYGAWLTHERHEEFWSGVVQRRIHREPTSHNPSTARDGASDRTHGEHGPPAVD
jgi:hypothetical protein